MQSGLVPVQPDIAERFQGLLDDVFEERLFDWTAADAQACARIMEIKRHRGELLDSHLPDAMIAGTAVRHGLTVVTRNETLAEIIRHRFSDPKQTLRELFKRLVFNVLCGN